jgi:hypothetical protein
MLLLLSRVGELNAKSLFWVFAWPFIWPIPVISGLIEALSAR